MSSRSIVDRVLLSAAAVCAAGLVWQLTVLMTSRSHTPALRSIETVSTASAQAASSPTPPSPATPAIRVVYPDTGAPKVVAKATDTPDGAPVAAAAPSDTTPAVLKVAASSAPASGSPAAPTVANAATVAVANAATVAVANAATASSQSAAPSAPIQPAIASAASQPADVAALAPPAQEPVAQPPAASDDARPSSGQGVNINRASVDELNRLPGAGRIGQAIASHRPYRSVEDLLKKRVVRRSVYDQIKNQIAAD